MDFLTILLCAGVFLVGVILGVVMTLSLVCPPIGRAIGRVVGRSIAAVALALAAALTVWPTVCLIRGDQMRAIALPFRNSSIAEPGESYGCSACLLVLGGISLWLSFRGPARRSDEKV